MTAEASQWNTKASPLTGSRRQQGLPEVMGPVTAATTIVMSMAFTITVWEEPTGSFLSKGLALQTICSISIYSVSKLTVLDWLNI